MQFSKMHGLGNDFMVVDAVTQNVFFSPELIRRLADRHLGIGFDQLLIVEPPYDPDLDFHYRIFNADGSEVAQCGNGARCFARFVQLKGLTNKSDIRVSTQNGRMVLTVTPDDQVRVNMGEPNFEPQQVPFRANKAENLYLLRVAEQTVMLGAVSMGNPHCVIQVESVKTAQVELLGPILELKRESDRGWFRHTGETFYHALQVLFGPRHPGAKLIALLIVGVVLFFSFASGTFRISAKTVVEGAV